MEYRKTQFSPLLIGIFLSVILFMLYAYYTELGDNPVSLNGVITLEAILVAALLIFHKMTVVVQQQTLRVIYGIGLVRFSFDLSEVVYVKSIRSNWWYGIGIRLTPEGVLYSISGLKAVKIEYMKKGKKKQIMVGSAEPDKLREAIEAIK